MVEWTQHTQRTEGTKEQMYEITRRFAEEFLGGEYEGVFSVHTDKDHLHRHLVFNSVNMVTGRKYAYKKRGLEECDTAHNQQIV